MPASLYDFILTQRENGRFPNGFNTKENDIVRRRKPRLLRAEKRGREARLVPVQGALLLPPVRTPEAPVPPGDWGRGVSAAGPVWRHRLFQNGRGRSDCPVLQPAQGPLRLRLLHHAAPVFGGGGHSHLPSGQARAPAPDGDAAAAGAGGGGVPPHPVQGRVCLVAGAACSAVDGGQGDDGGRSAGRRGGHGVSLCLHGRGGGGHSAGNERGGGPVRPAPHPVGYFGLSPGTAGEPAGVRPGRLPGGAAPEGGPPGAGARARPAQSRGH